VSDETLMRFLPGRSPSDAPTAVAVFWPEPQYRAVIARWSELAALLGGTWDECRVRTQQYCVLADGHGLRIMQVAAEDTAARAEIAASLAAAWQRAAPPFAPLHRIPGITWSPVEAVVAHVPAR
jgi:hypothetical protein